MKCTVMNCKGEALYGIDAEMAIGGLSPVPLCGDHARAWLQSGERERWVEMPVGTRAEPRRNVAVNDFLTRVRSEADAERTIAPSQRYDAPIQDSSADFDEHYKGKS